MAANCARRAFLSSTASARSTFLNGCRSGSPSSSFASGSSKLGGFASSAKPTSTRFSLHKSPFSSRLPVELGCAQSLMPLHSVTASALLTSKLSLKSGNWSWLSEGGRGVPWILRRWVTIVDKLHSVVADMVQDLQHLYSRAYELIDQK